MARYEFRSPDLEIRVIDPAIEGGVGVRIEHASGAALIVPSAPARDRQSGLHLGINGFDGTHFEIQVEADLQSIVVRCSEPSAILGGQSEIRATRAPEAERESGPVRVTGDETTMPIAVEDE